MSKRASKPEHPAVEAARDRAVLAAALDPIITIDFSGIIRSASDSVERVFGWKASELLGRNVSVLMPEPHRSAHDGYLARYRATGQTNILNRPRRFEAVRKDGTLFPIELSVSRADIPGEASPLFVGIIRDLSDRDSGEAAAGRENARLHELLAEQTAALQSAQLRLRMADRMASIGTLAAGLGHDMNNVLLPVRAHLNALAVERSLSLPERLKHVSKIRKSVQYLQQLADGLHFLALDPEHEDSGEGSTDLRKWWSQTGTLIAKAVPKHVKVIASFPPSLPEVAAPPHRITQAVLNLVVNAGEAIPPLRERRRRQGLVRIWAQASPDESMVEIGVSDNGRGMSEEVRRRAFEMFFTTKTRGLGTGLGLPLVRKVAERAGGSVRIESKEGEGTTVVMTLAAARPKAGPESEARRVVAVSIREGRLKALVRTLIESAGGLVVDGLADDRADAWFVQADTGTLDRAKAWLRRRPGGRLVLIGSPADAPDAWRSLGVDIISDEADFEKIRSAVALALAARGVHSCES